MDELAPSELEGVLAHELAHVARRDNLVALVATAFLGATACLPTSWSALRNLLHERELAADELAVSITGKPITLARVLHKAATADFAATGIASGLLEAATAEARIHHLVALHRAGTGSAPGIAHWPWIPVLTLVAPPVLAWLVFALPHLLALP
jgi:Zn-dependent protease with chaperone function